MRLRLAPGGSVGSAVLSSSSVIGFFFSCRRSFLRPLADRLAVDVGQIMDPDELAGHRVQGAGGTRLRAIRATDRARWEARKNAAP